MTLRSLRLLAIGLMAIAAIAWSMPAAAQTYTGRIDITLEDATGARLPGVTVEITGPMNQSEVTDARGEVRFLNLAVGIYQVRATLGGFNEYKNTNVPVTAGGAIPLTIKLGVSGAKEEVTVTAESPVIDTKKSGTNTAVSFDELQKVPSARDPWVVMQSVPGIIMDRVNVGGSESGQQSGFMGKGAGSGDTTWNVDGMPITDMSSLSSPFYYDFDMFQEMNIVTGGSDAKSATGGIQMNMVLKSGTNSYHGNVRTYFENESMQSTNLPPELSYLASPSDPTKGDRTQQFVDWGGDLGGPILKDRWWAWGAFGKQDIRILKLNGASDRTVLPNISVKTQAQITQALRGSFTFFQANKQKWGRNAGPTRPQETTVNQDGPNQMWKGEVNYVFGNNLFLVGRYAYVKGGFTFDPQGGMDKPSYMDDGGVYRQSYGNYITDRPQNALVIDGNYFKGAHEIKFGFTWRKTEVHSFSEWPGGNNIFTYHDGYPDMLAQVTAPNVSDAQSKYLSFYAGDTITLNRATINLGLRFDNQVGSVLPSESAAVPGFENVLPKVVAPGIDSALTFNLLQPRVGVTYALDESRKTQLRATYAMFTSQIGTGAASFLSVAQYRYVYYHAYDTNGNKSADPNEVDRSTVVDWGGFDINNPSATATSYNKVGDYGVPRTNEVIFGVDRELFPGFGMSASFTYRHIGNVNWRPLIGITRASYVQVGTQTGVLPGDDKVPGATGGSYTIPIYGLSSASLIPAGKGTEYKTRDGYHQRYMGFEVSATKRMANNWMARLGFSTNDWREYFDDPNTSQTDPTSLLGTPNIDGGYVVSASGGSGKSGIYMVQPKYQFIANGSYQAPWDINFGVNFLVRQGYPMPWFRRTTGIADPNLSTKQLLAVGDFGQDRLPATSTVDIRVGKLIKLGSRVNLNIDFDIFNLMNSATVLGRQYDMSRTTGTTASPNVLEIMQPRIARIGGRITF